MPRKQKKNNGLELKDVIKNCIQLCGEIYKEVQSWNYFTKETLGKQLFRSAVSVPSNISEGHNRSKGNVKKFYGIALGSAYEAVTQLRIAFSCSLMTKKNAESYISSYQAVIHYLNDKLKEIYAYIKSKEQEQHGFEDIGEMSEFDVMADAQDLITEEGRGAF